MYQCLNWLIFRGGGALIALQSIDCTGIGPVQSKTSSMLICEAYASPLNSVSVASNSHETGSCILSVHGQIETKLNAVDRSSSLKTSDMGLRIGCGNMAQYRPLQNVKEVAFSTRSRSYLDLQNASWLNPIGSQPLTFCR